MTDTPDTATAEATPLSAAALRAKEISFHPWKTSAFLLRELAQLAGIGALLRLWVVPDATTAVIAWAVSLAVLTAMSYASFRPRRAAAGWPQAPGTWVPGQPPIKDLPADTAWAIESVLGRFRSRRYPQGVRVEIIPCQHPVRHGACNRAGAGHDIGAVRMFLGVHLAEHPAEAAWVVAHESQHPVGVAWWAWSTATSARLIAWAVAGWAVPWPWLLVALAGIQAAYAAIGAAMEVYCDLRATHICGRGQGLAAFAFLRSAGAARRGSRSVPGFFAQLLVWVVAQTPHFSLRLRAAIIRVVFREQGRR